MSYKQPFDSLIYDFGKLHFILLIYHSETYSRVSPANNAADQCKEHGNVYISIVAKTILNNREKIRF